MFVRAVLAAGGRNAAPRSWAVPARPRTRRWARCRPGWAGWRVRRRWSRPAMPSGPGIVRVQPGGGVPRRTLTCTWKAVRVQMGAQDVAGGAPVGADHEAQVAGGGRASGYGAHGIVGIAGLVGQHFQRVPAEQPFGQAQTRLAPVRIRFGRVVVAADLDGPARTAAGMGGGRRPSTCRRPRASTRLASACARISRGWAARRPSCPSDARGCAD